jgi:hypothetical protein
MVKIGMWKTEKIRDIQNCFSADYFIFNGLKYMDICDYDDEFYSSLEYACYINFSLYTLTKTSRPSFFLNQYLPSE